MWGIVLFGLSIIVAVNIFLWVINRGKEKMNVPEGIDRDLLDKSENNPTEADPRKDKKKREYLSVGLLRDGLSKDGKNTVETSDKGKKILSG